MPVLLRETPRERHDDFTATVPEGHRVSASTSAAHPAARRPAANAAFSISVTPTWSPALRGDATYACGGHPRRWHRS